MSDAAERLKWLCSPDAERLSDCARINQFVKAGMDVTNEIVRLRSAIEAIKQATIEGRVCDDVAWFDTITTLHDYCEQTLMLCHAHSRDAFVLAIEKPQSFRWT
jgi:hypothetical protein